MITIHQYLNIYIIFHANYLGIKIYLVDIHVNYMILQFNNYVLSSVRLLYNSFSVISNILIIFNIKLFIK